MNYFSKATSLTSVKTLKLRSIEMPEEFLVGIRESRKRMHLFYWVSNSDSVS